jgi:hypothetical protein
MDKAMFIPSAILGLLFIVVYACQCYRHKKEFNYQIMINAVLQASGIVCGIVLIGSTFFESLRQYLSNLNIYIFISGLAMLAVSIQTVHRDLFFKGKISKNAIGQPQNTGVVHD